jgi:hypothetical protein
MRHGQADVLYMSPDFYTRIASTKPLRSNILPILCTYDETCQLVQTPHLFIKLNPVLTQTNCPLLKG